MLRHFILESNRRGGVEIHYAFNTVVEGLTTEEPDADNVSSVLVDHQSSVTFRDLLIGKARCSNFAIISTSTAAMSLSKTRCFRQVVQPALWTSGKRHAR